jgi:multicomponent Na+:H+ antiporter subunit D
VIDPVSAVILVPLAGAVGAAVAGRHATPVATLTAVAASLAGAWLLASVWTDGPQRLALGGWEAPLGIELRADGLAAVMVAAGALVAGVTTLYAAAMIAPADPHGGWTGRRAFWPLWLFLWGALNAAFLTRDLFNFYVSLELLTLAAVALVVRGEDRAALTAAMRYLLAAFFGSLLYLVGVALLYGSHGALDIAVLAAAEVEGPAVWAALALVSVGLLLKSALFPLHFWLPRAHASAPPAVSAVLSGLVVKASFVMLVRIWLEVFPVEMTVPASQVVAALGVVAIGWGSLQAIRSQRLKLLIAHSTVAQVGYLAVVLPLILPAVAMPGIVRDVSLEAWQGGFYHLVTHAFAKAAMFLAAGAVAIGYGSDRLNDLAGAAKTHPLAFFAIALAGVSLIGLPPSGGFVAKWLLVGAALAEGQWWWAAAILGGGLLTAGYVFLVIGHGLARSEPRSVAGDGRRVAVPRTLELCAFGLGLASVALGVRAIEPLALLEAAFPGAGG